MVESKSFKKPANFECDGYCGRSDGSTVDNRSMASSAMGADREEMVNERLRSIVSNFRER